MEKKNMDIMMERMERAGFENIKDRIMFGVMNHERNQDIAEQAFHIKWNDLLIFFYIEGTFLNGTAYHCPVSIDMAESWEVSMEEVLVSALQNMQREYPPRVSRIEDLLGLSDMGSPMHIISNQKGILGAGVMFYHGLLEEFAEREGSNLYILPSSIHECIVVPEEEGIGKDVLFDMVKEVNHTVVSRDERLADNVYYYDCKTKEMRALF